MEQQKDDVEESARWAEWRQRVARHMVQFTPTTARLRGSDTHTHTHTHRWFLRSSDQGLQGLPQGLTGLPLLLLGLFPGLRC
jgi:hypothetical protein